MKHSTCVSVVAVLCVLSFWGCRSQDIFRGSNGIVRYQQYAKENPDIPILELVLVQDTHKDCESILSTQNNSICVKKTPSEIFKFLITYLVDECNFLEAGESKPPRARTIMPDRVITVENEYGTWTAKSACCIDECTAGYTQINTFPEMVRCLRYIFDNTFYLHTYENEESLGAQYFYEEQAWLERITRKPVND
ncbi:MAG: hypothetical protein ABIK28_11050 [Planctomycetota bacterium]